MKFLYLEVTDTKFQAEYDGSNRVSKTQRYKDEKMV